MGTAPAHVRTFMVMTDIHVTFIGSGASFLRRIDGTVPET
jgi:hypothetical protein